MAVALIGDLKTGKTIGQLMSKATTGEFYITLPVGGQYAYFATIKGYLNQSQKIDLSKDKKFREVKFEIQSHESSELGLKEESNLDLSNRGAKSVSDYLLSKGVPTARLRSKGYGSSKPTVANDTEENRIKNRRVSFIVLKD